MKKVISFAIIGLLAFAGLTLTGCGGGGDNKVVELEEASPARFNQVQMEEYSKQMSSQGNGNPGLALETCLRPSMPFANPAQGIFGCVIGRCGFPKVGRWKGHVRWLSSLTRFLKLLPVQIC